MGRRFIAVFDCVNMNWYYLRSCYFSYTYCLLLLIIRCITSKLPLWLCKQYHFLHFRHLSFLCLVSFYSVVIILVIVAALTPITTVVSNTPYYYQNRSSYLDNSNLIPFDIYVLLVSNVGNWVGWVVCLGLAVKHHSEIIEVVLLTLLLTLS